MRLRNALAYLRPRYLWKNRRGLCPVCGGRTLFLLTDDDATIRNHAICVRCRSCSRNRHLALMVVRELGLASLCDLRSRQDLVVYNTCSTGAILKVLGRGRNVLCSEFFDDVPRGALKDGVRNEDLQALTFADASIDLILSEDVFEHVPDMRRGFEEVHRVLKPGGRHIFSIPFYFDRRTRELFLREGDKRVLLEPIEYHGDPVRGSIPCFTHIGYDTLDMLREIGFETRIEISWYAEQVRYGTYDCYTFVTRKR